MIKLLDLSRRCTDIGDLWREFALIASRVCKGRSAVQDSFDDLSALLYRCAAEEKELFKDLRTTITR